MDKDIKKESVKSEGKDKHNDMKTNKNKTQLVVVFIIGLLIGTFASPLIFSDSYESDEITSDNNTLEKIDIPSGTEERDVSTLDTTSSDNVITVLDQLAGDRVLIDTVELSVSGWVVVHEDLEGSFGNALGAARFDTGQHKRGYVKLLRNTVPDTLYYVILYQDNGDKQFSLSDDIPLTDLANNPIGATFRTIMIDRKTN